MPINVVPAGPLALPFPSAATLLAWSSNYQAQLGVGSAAAAIDSIHYPYVDLTTPPVAPFAVLTDGDDLPQTMDHATFEQSGELMLDFYFIPNSTKYGGPYTDPRDIILDFRNKLGAILDDMLTNARNLIPDESGNWFWGMTGWEKAGTPQFAYSQDTDTLQIYNGKPVTEVLWASFKLKWVS
jgi:hypothetical protein